MSKIWVNGQEINLETLTAEQLSALTESYNHNFHNPNGVYINDTLIGDGSFDLPYGVAKLPNSLTVSVINGNGEICKSEFDGTREVEISLNNYKDVVDNNTIVGNGTEQSPLKVSNTLLSAVDSAYTTSIATALLLENMQMQIDKIALYNNEISAKCDSAVEDSVLSNMIAEDSINIALSANTNVDSLYDLISTLIYNIVYDDLTNNLIINYVDGTQNSININDISTLEQQVDSINDFIISLNQIIKDINYDKESSSIIVTYVNDSQKIIVLDDIELLKNTITNTTLLLQNLQERMIVLEQHQSAITESLVEIMDSCSEQRNQIANSICGLSFQNDKLTITYNNGNTEFIDIR